MLKKEISKPGEHLVYILIDKKYNAHVNISNDARSVFEKQSGLDSKLVYFERHCDRGKALRKKRYLTQLNESDRLKLVRKHNPEMLNLIFTIYDTDKFMTKPDK